MVSWFLRAHRAAHTAPARQVERTNRGMAVSITWTETLWAWIWLELPKPEYAVGWPEGSQILTYPLTSRRFAEYIELEASTNAA